MCSDWKLSRLRRLVDDSLRLYTESDVVLATKEREILVALSRVLRQLKLWTQALDSDSDNAVVIGLDCDGDCICLTKIVTNLVVLITVESKYVKHLACNVLVAVSEFVAALGSSWDEFIRLLCVCVDLGINAAISCSSSPSKIGADYLHSGSSGSLSLILLLKTKMVNPDWSVPAGVIRVLHDIVKYLKSEDDEELVEVFFDSVNSVLSTVPWDSLHESCVGRKPDAQKSSSSDALFRRSLFLGNLVQFLCSLVEQSGSRETAGGFVDKNYPIFSTVNNLVPKLLCWCLGERADCVNFSKCMSQYFRHKLLVLLTRLIFQTCPPDQSVLVSWLQLIHKYFGELLSQPIRVKYDQDDCLEGSPFLSSVSDTEVNSLSSRHLQRQAVFLFLKCSLDLVSSKGTNKKFSCATWNLCLTGDSNAELECCGSKRGLLELYSWFQGHLPTDIHVDHEMYFEICIDFAKSFLQLYIKEDDMLFKVLLQLLCVHFCAEEQFGKETGAFQDSKGTMLFRVSDLFNPVVLFHLFLLELSYDQQVLLDYLISKDTGISCAEYLLRCLRKVCESWSLFVEFPMGGQATNKSSCKKRKVSMDGSSFWGEDSCAPEKGHRVITFHDDKSEEENKHVCKDDPNGGQYFKEAKECLVSLKISIESLHRKNLFPYNPNALLNRLKKFQELCLDGEN